MKRLTAVGRSAAAGICAAVAALAATEFLSGLLPLTRSLFVAVGDRVIELAPGRVVAFAIRTFGTSNRPVLLVAMGLTIVTASAIVGVLAARWFWPAATVGFGGFALVAAAAGIADPQFPSVAAVMLSAAAAILGIAILAVLLRVGATTTAALSAERTDATAPTPGGPVPATRRAFLRVAGGVVAAAALGVATGRILLERTAGELARLGVALPRVRHSLPPPPPDLAELVRGLSPLLTPNADFYRIDTAFALPRLHVDGYRLRITGMVTRPVELTYADIVRRVDREADVTLACVSNEVGGPLVGTARWLGFRLANLLDEVGVEPGADQVVGRSVDGWTAGFPTEAVYDGRDALVVIGMNGDPLPRAHGFPVRLVIAGLYGYVSATKWLTEIELTGWNAYDAFWVPRGWAKEAPIKTQSRIDVPHTGSQRPAGQITVAGVAWAGVRGVERVELRVDSGPWKEAQLSDEVATAAWRQWLYKWDATPGEHWLTVQATDGTGEVQSSTWAGPLPDGATGHHTVRVIVSAP